MKRPIVVMAVIALATVGVVLGKDLVRRGDPDVMQAREMLASTVKVDLKHVVSARLEFEGGQVLEIPRADLGGSGTGFIADREDMETLVMTADHVCDDWVDKELTLDSWFGEVKVSLHTLEHELTVTNFEGDDWRAFVVVTDEGEDICAVKVDSPSVGPVAKIAETTPAAGAKLIHTGAPLGLWERHAGAVVDGRSMGIMKIGGRWDELMGMSLSSDGGSSGGPVWYDGEVVGTLVAGYEPSGNFTFAVQAEYLRATLLKARTKWLRMRTQ